MSELRPSRDDERWQPMSSAPQDGSPVWLWIVHPLARYERDPIEAGYEAPVEAHWIDHNGGGWTWYGLAGQWTKWMPRDQEASAPLSKIRAQSLSVSRGAPVPSNPHPSADATLSERGGANG